MNGWLDPDFVPAFLLGLVAIADKGNDCRLCPRLRVID